MRCTLAILSIGSRMGHNKAKQYQSLRSLDSLALASLCMAAPFLHKPHNHKSAVVGSVIHL